MCVVHLPYLDMQKQEHICDFSHSISVKANVLGKQYYTNIYIPVIIASSAMYDPC